MTTATTSPPAAPLMLDWLLPEFDATIVEHQVIEGDPESIYRAVDHRRHGRDPAHATPPYASSSPPAAPPSAWSTRCSAARRPPRCPRAPCGSATCPSTATGSSSPMTRRTSSPSASSAASGAARRSGRRSTPTTSSRSTGPGFAKIACSVSLRPYGTAHTLVSYEARTQALDPESRAHFLRYWRVVRPGVAIVMRAFLHAVAKEVSDANPRSVRRRARSASCWARRSCSTPRPAPPSRPRRARSAGIAGPRARSPSLTGLIGAYVAVGRPLMLHWGATCEDLHAEPCRPLHPRGHHRGAARRGLALAGADRPGPRRLLQLRVAREPRRLRDAQRRRGAPRVAAARAGRDRPPASAERPRGRALRARPRARARGLGHVRARFPTARTPRG